jgi:hypothetical protein
MFVQANPAACVLPTDDVQRSEPPIVDLSTQKKRKILVAHWVMVEGKLVCQWIIE